MAPRTLRSSGSRNPIPSRSACDLRSRADRLDWSQPRTFRFAPANHSPVAGRAPPNSPSRRLNHRVGAEVGARTLWAVAGGQQRTRSLSRLWHRDVARSGRGAASIDWTLGARGHSQSHITRARTRLRTQLGSRGSVAFSSPQAGVVRKSRFTGAEIVAVLEDQETGLRVAKPLLDEVAELPSHVLEVLRQPLEDGAVTISRAAMTLSYPARFLFVAAMNPCPCGHAGDPQRACCCPPQAVQRYLARISGPLLDRMDIHLSVPPVAYADLAGSEPAESSAAIRQRVEAARARQRERFADVPGVHANAHMGPRWIRIDAATEVVLRRAIERLGLSARAYHRVLKLARTLADLAGEDEIGPRHVAEAVQYRVLDRGEG
ncbi:MAG: ATP-binding protein [Gemmatimonadetes bacterium]|nr:ATP-binding protein [Gemmatimonadota bacterium]